MYALYATDANGRELIGRYDSFEEGAIEMDIRRIQGTDDKGYMLIREDDDDGTRV